MTDNKKRKIITAAVIIAAAILFYILMRLTPLYTDDYSYHYIFIKTTHKSRVTNLSELITSQIGHYKYMNGRTVVHTLAQIFLMWGKPIFNFISAGVFVLLGILIYYHGFGELQEIKPQRLAFIWFLLWISMPAFGQSCLWLVGSCNYMYGPVIVLLYLIPFTKNRETSEQIKSIPLSILYLFVGILAGWTVENLAAAAVIITICHIINDAIRFGKVPAWMMTGLIGNIIGASLIVMSPGQETRIEGYNGIGGVSQWVRRAVSITVRGGYYLIVPIVIICVLLVIYILQNRDTKFKKILLELSDVLIFTLGTLASIYSMVLAPVFPERTWSIPAIFIIITLLLFARHIEPIKIGSWIKPAAIIILTSVFLVSYIYAAVDINKTRAEVEEREASIMQQKEEGKTTITIPAVTGKTRWNCYDEYGDLIDDPEQWPNTAFAIFYEADTVIKEK